MRKILLSALTAFLFTQFIGCVTLIAQAPYIKEQRQQAVAHCDKFEKLEGHHFTYCPNTHYAIAKKGIGQYTLIKPTGEMTAYYDDIKYSNHLQGQYYFIIKRGKHIGVMNLDGKIILPLDNYRTISYEYPKGFAICGAFGSIGDTGYKKNCYDENGHKSEQY